MEPTAEVKFWNLVKEVVQDFIKELRRMLAFQAAGFKTHELAPLGRARIGEQMLRGYPFKTQEVGVAEIILEGVIRRER